MKTEVTSIVIVRNSHGLTATMRFTNPMKDKIISGTSRTGMYAQIESYVKDITNG